ncbi:LysR family transcriptional regulator [Cryobacterium sp. PH29-G1]|uniref:LysR family transcriptional regulator n=1 Tax=Cryobacterium sp. PH29-G1 TaxID=3046211 RepID=UPI0024BB40CB|nr:LysR family transcriptional regulator [Cryobacterium sp. PH29-G1]MDJ0351069.1 LysR family transcriptional regulator [Cryobacterium sp. PH29-G1]
MELRHLRYFSKVASLRSVSQAALALNITQPALSRQIKDLERSLGYVLFDRTPRGVTLTAAGAGLFAHCETVFAQVERIPEVLRTAAQNRVMLHVGVPQGLPYDWFLGLLRAVDGHVPTIALTLHEATTDEQWQMLQSKLVDVALIHREAPEAGGSLLLMKQEIGVAVTADSPLAHLPQVGFAQLDGLSVMAHAVGEIATQEIRLRAAATAAGVTMQWVFRRFSEHSGLIALTAKVDAVLLTQSSAARHLPDWVWIPVRAERDPSFDLAISTWATWNEPHTSHVESLLAVMRSEARPNG